MSQSRGTASILIPQVAGGGAEKIVMGIARALHHDGRLSRIYSGSDRGAEAFDGLPLVDLGASRALGAIRPLASRIRDDPAQTFFMTLGYMNLAPVIRLMRPSARIVLRLGSMPTAEASYRKGLERLRYAAGPRLAYGAADCIIVQGESMRGDIVRAQPSIAAKVRVIHNFVEPDLWEFEPGPAPMAGPYLFCAATFRPEKGLDILLEAYAASKARGRRRLVIAGVDPDDAAFTNLMREHELTDDEVVRLGFVTRPYDWIAHAELAVLSSRYEGFSNFLLEAAALGKRIVATEAPGGNAELMRIYRNGTLVALGVPNPLSAALDEPRSDLPPAEARRRLTSFAWPTIRKLYYEALFAGRG